RLAAVGGERFHARVDRLAVGRDPRVVAPRVEGVEVPADVVRGRPLLGRGGGGPGGSSAEAKVYITPSRCLIGGGVPHCRTMVASLRVEVKGEPPFEVLLDRELIGVGRAPDNALGLRDMNVSRHHFAIERRDDGVYLLHDRGSRNGTVVNGT